eukprot:125084-Pelagomonas_calceolata.AAC.1
MKFTRVTRDPPKSHEVYKCLTPVRWKTSDTILIDKSKREEAEISSYRPIGLANTLYKPWTRLITNTLYEYAEAHSLLSTTQA